MKEPNVFNTTADFFSKVVAVALLLAAAYAVAYALPRIVEAAQMAAAVQR